MNLESNLKIDFWLYHIFYYCVTTIFDKNILINFLFENIVKDEKNEC